MSWREKVKAAAEDVNRRVCARSAPTKTTETLSVVSVGSIPEETAPIHSTQALPRGTCGEPVAAGPAPNFGIVWPPAGHAASCVAFTPKPAPEAAGRAYALSAAQGDAAHAEAWDDAAIGRFMARVAGIQRRGFGAQDAEDLAEQLHQRDLYADYRHLCIECRHYRPGRCSNHKPAGLSAPEVGRDLVVMFQHCAGFLEVTT